MQPNFLCDIKNGNILSEYNHGNYIDSVDGRPCLHMDCSGFIFWYLLNSGYKRALAELKFFLKENNFIKITRFYCKDFVEIYRHKDDFHYWNFLQTPDIGTLLIVVFPNGNGHCMLVNKIIEERHNGYVLNIIDSTRYPHRNDSRTAGQTGIGVGDISISIQDGQWYYDAYNDALGIRQATIYFVKPMK